MTCNDNIVSLFGDYFGVLSFYFVLLKGFDALVQVSLDEKVDRDLVELLHQLRISSIDV